MSKKLLHSKLELKGIAPNLLLKDIEVTAPFIFQGELKVEGEKREYLQKLIFYKKNLKLLKNLSLTDYFSLCLYAHWATAGTFVPTNVDNQIREGLWKHPEILKHLEAMVNVTIDSWKWDYRQVTRRIVINPHTEEVMSTHEGTWLSVAIGAWCAAVKYQRTHLVKRMEEVILSEIEKEEKLLLELQKNRDHLNFLRMCALMAHNFGDLDRVLDQWQVPEDQSFRQRIYKLGHVPNPSYSKVLVFAGQVNKKFLAVENHRHMSMRQPKCLRRSSDFLIPVGPFMDEWGQILGRSEKLTNAEKGEIVCALLEGFKRQNLAFGYPRAYAGLISQLPEGLHSLDAHIPFDVVAEIKKSKFGEIASLPVEDFQQMFIKNLDGFICPVTDWHF